MVGYEFLNTMDIVYFGSQVWRVSHKRFYHMAIWLVHIVDQNIFDISVWNLIFRSCSYQIVKFFKIIFNKNCEKVWKRNFFKIKIEFFLKNRSGKRTFFGVKKNFVIFELFRGFLKPAYWTRRRERPSSSDSEQKSTMVAVARRSIAVNMFGVFTTLQ